MKTLCIWNILLLACAAGACARQLQQAKFADYRPVARIALVDSPYYLPGITNTVGTFPSSATDSPATAFRMMGAPATRVSKGDFALSWEQAYQACQDVGLGLVGILDDARQAAVDDLTRSAATVSPDNADTGEGCCGGFIWTGGVRTGLTDANCTAANGGRWPYFIQSTVPGVPGTGYLGCGRDPIKDWAWRTNLADGSPLNISWASTPSAATHWYTNAATGGKWKDQPEAWVETTFNVTAPFSGYENCTAGFLLAGDLQRSATVASALNRVWFDDFGCGANLARWICEFESDAQGVTPDMASANRNSPAATAANSFYSMPGVTALSQPSGNGTEVFRIMGIAPDRARTLARNAPGGIPSQAPGGDGHLSWDDAQAICTNAGGSGLPAVRSGASSLVQVQALLSAASARLAAGNSSKFWVGPATANPAACPIASGSASGAVTIGATGCDDANINMLVCAFPTALTGYVEAPDTAPIVSVPIPVSPSSPGKSPGAPQNGGSSKSNVGAIVGGVVGGIAGLCLLALCLFFVARRKRESERYEEPESLKPSKAAHAAALYSEAPSAHEAPASDVKAVSPYKHDAADPGHPYDSGYQYDQAAPGGTADWQQSHQPDNGSKLAYPSDGASQGHPSAQPAAVVGYAAVPAPREPHTRGPPQEHWDQQASYWQPAADQALHSEEQQPQQGFFGVADGPDNAAQAASQGPSDRQQSLGSGGPGGGVAKLPLEQQLGSLRGSLSAGPRGSLVHSASTRSAHTHTSTLAGLDTVGVTRTAHPAYGTGGGTSLDSGLYTGGVDGPVTVQASIHAMIDSFANTRTLFHGQYHLLPGHANRREGGQGVVAFASCVYNSDKWAVKFFGARQHFEEEQAMYRIDALRNVLPEVRDIVGNDQGQMVAPNGAVVPSFVILGHGQPFDEWCEHVSPDFPLALQVLLHVGKKLQLIHAAGYAHRDVKPSNLILDSRTKNWVLIDFASAAPIGEVATLSYSVMYAPPELAAAVHAGERRMMVSGAGDVWALGVMAWKLLTSIHPFADPAGGTVTTAEVLDKLCGRQLLPWELPLEREVRVKLGILSPTIRSMLQRDPAQRATMDGLLKAWAALFHAPETTSCL